MLYGVIKSVAQALQRKVYYDWVLARLGVEGFLIGNVHAQLLNR